MKNRILLPLAAMLCLWSCSKNVSEPPYNELVEICHNMVGCAADVPVGKLEVYHIVGDSAIFKKGWNGVGTSSFLGQSVGMYMERDDDGWIVTGETMDGTTLSFRTLVRADVVMKPDTTLDIGLTATLLSLEYDEGNGYAATLTQSSNLEYSLTYKLKPDVRRKDLVIDVDVNKIGNASFSTKYDSSPLDLCKLIYSATVDSYPDYHIEKQRK